IKHFVDEQQDNILDPQIQSKLENLIPTDGMSYQVVDSSGNVLYGTLDQKMIINAETFIKKMNTTGHDNDESQKYFPITDEDQHLKGGIVLSYPVSFIASNPDHQWLMRITSYGMLTAPLIYLALFTFVFT